MSAKAHAGRGYGAGFVYFARHGDEVKIGYSRKPEWRVLQLATARPGVRLVATIPAVPRLEWALHQHFASARMRGEWFRWTRRIAKYAKNPYPIKEEQMKKPVSKVGPPPTEAAPKFSEWIRKYGEEKLAADMEVSVWTVFKWRQRADGQPNGAAPRPKHLTKLLEIAKGKLKPADIYPHESA